MRLAILAVVLVAVVAGPMVALACPPPPAPGYDGGGAGSGPSPTGDGSGFNNTGGMDNTSNNVPQDATTGDETV